MNTREITVEARAAGPGGPAGEAKPATLMICDCGCEAFCVYAVTDHLHLQCIECGESYCRGEGHGCGLAAPPMKCRVCGCTQDTPCVSAGGEACYWIEPYLCSACAAKELGRGDRVVMAGPGALNLTVGDMRALDRLPVASVRLPAVECFMALSALQLALRHPDVPENIQLSVTRLAGALEEHIAVTPNLQAICAAGWNPDLDVPAERRIITP